jgi:hypothetical protein
VLPFAPAIVLPAIDHFIHRLKLKEFNPYGFKATFNATYPGKAGSTCGVALALRTQSRADRADDRELSQRFVLATHPKLLIYP